MIKADQKAVRVLKNAAFLFGLPIAAIFYPFALALVHVFRWISKLAALRWAQLVSRIQSELS